MSDSKRSRGRVVIPGGYENSKVDGKGPDMYAAATVTQTPDDGLSRAEWNRGHGRPADAQTVGSASMESHGSVAGSVRVRRPQGQK